MIVGNGERNGQPLIIIGITEGNVERLRAGQPLLLKMENYPGVVASVAVFYGATIGDLQADLMDAAPNAKINVMEVEP